tara:strand:+ start:5287 stop:5394 length:108 start_codon:yes stop_codon:yes gene_type:complete
MYLSDECHFLKIQNSQTFCINDFDTAADGAIVKFI